MRRGLRLVLATAGDMEVVAEAADPRSTARAMGRSTPDVLALDLDLYSHAESKLIAPTAHAAGIGVVVLSMHEVPDFARRVLGTGVLGFVRKQFADTELAPAIRAAVRQEAYVAPPIAARLRTSP